ncbi:MAG: hypothetical protein JWQ66_303 [Mucilaginibacter sp.]|nr:hypothetical protein [Mucilaginibacter sp.]
MKTQCINIDQALSGISNLVITSITSLEWHKLFFAFNFSPKRIGNYLLPLLKELFRDNFMGSDMEMGILLLFVKSYFLLAVYVIRHNALTDRVKKLNKSINESVELNHEDIYTHKQAA